MHISLWMKSRLLTEQGSVFVSFKGCFNSLRLFLFGSYLEVKHVELNQTPRSVMAGLWLNWSTCTFINI